MHTVFISYSTKDMAPAEKVRDVLEKNGIPCWMAPRDIPGGSNYAGEIPRAIRSSQVFLLMLSDNAQSSNWVVKELDMAVNCGKVILPLMLEDFPLNDEFNFLLTGAQRYTAYRKSEEVLGNLVQRIRAVSGVPAVEEVQPAAVVAPKPEAPAAPIVKEANPKKEKPEKEKIPFTFGKTEGLAALVIPVALLLVLGAYVLGNYYYRRNTFGTIGLSSVDSLPVVWCSVISVLVSAGIWLEWICFRHREQYRNPEQLHCPSCGADRLRINTFRTCRMTGKEWGTVALIPVCMVLAAGCPLVVLSAAKGWYHPLHKCSMMFAGAALGLVAGCWLANLLVRHMRRKAGLRSMVCRCESCRATFLPGGKRK